MMRSLAVAALFAACGASAQGLDPSVNLDRPGALAALQQERPEHYRAVVRTLRAAERMHCGVDFRLLQVGDRNPCVSHLIRTSYPAQVPLTIPLEGTRYAITAYLDNSLDRMTPAR